MSDGLYIPLHLGLNIDSLSQKQINELIKLCQKTVTEFLNDPTRGKNRVSNMIRDEFPTVNITEELLDKLADNCQDDIDECIRNNWDTMSRDILYDSVKDILQDMGLLSSQVCRYMFTKGIHKGEICGIPVVPGSNYCRSCIRKKDVQSRELPEVDKETTIDAIIINEKLGYYLETTMELLIKVYPDDSIEVRGVYRKDNLEKPFILNDQEVNYCKKKGLKIEPNATIEPIIKNHRALIVQKYWKKYWYFSKDENGESPYIKSLKKKASSMIL